MRWYTKSRRAQNVDDYETWIAGGVSPTLNAMDNNGEAFATVLILFEPKSLFEENWSESKVKNALRANASKSSHLIIDGTRVNDVRVYEDGIVPTVISRYGTGGGNVPMIFDNSEPNETIAFDTQFGSNANTFENVSPTLKSSQQPPSFIETGLSVYPIDDGREIEKHQNGLGIGADGAPAYTLDQSQAPAVATQSTVRRLTPKECERLQGFPDDWTADQADSNRYKQCGNAVAVPVVEWIIKRMVGNE